jgi:cobalt-zinc-cadmium efflux system protein
MVGDAFSSLGAIAAGIAVVVWDADRADPVVSLLIAVLVVGAAFRLLRDTTHVLLEGVPSHLQPEAVEALLLDDPAVAAVHHLHLWSLASDAPALSAHIVMRDEVSLHDAQAHGDRLRAALLERFEIAHSTLELECHDCDPATGATRHRPDPAPGAR